ncbi:SemiSWEET transporter [Paraburkholderia aspalathi]|uniref:MtN3 and saliva related transmembrane protein n=1 Tax=Paraburkholderia aspalathi TaxID=1324617 RepID=A0A1I7B8Q9_9BURK|nr:SemiSWEET transporter [Paraburkholderia aspalathi]SFT83590.1 MtN3 and saliva related transmembrane protein [Paraburkholderia aspalathi]
MTSITEPIGYLAAIFSTASFIPQALLIWRTKSAEGVSVAMYSVFLTGTSLWLGYSFLINSWPMITSNIVALLLISFILHMKLSYG